jgi:guanylate kinase
MDKSNIFIISGPSGAGEDSIIKGLEKLMPIERVVTTTTREMRPGEEQGKPYYFISKEEFEKNKIADEFAEYAQEYNSNWYGVTKQELDRVASSHKIGVWKIEYQGVITAKEKFPEMKSIYIASPSTEILEQRIRRRDKNISEEYIKERMAYTQEWMQHENIYDYKIINEEGKLDEAIKSVAEIIKANAQLN